MRVAVYGLWHLGCVTAACLASAGGQTVGLDPNGSTVQALTGGTPPIEEPGLAEMIAAGLASGCLSFTTQPREALADADVLWVTFDTPVNDRDEADPGRVRIALEDVVGAVRQGTLVLISSQVPVGFTRGLIRDWHGRGLTFAYSPENLRLGKALRSFQHPERVIVGVGDERDRGRIGSLFEPFSRRIEWMSIESAEMTKHAINAFLATSVTFINELARLCEPLGADAKEVERGLRTEERIGPRAYLSPGAPFAGGTLARDLRFLNGLGRGQRVATPLFDGVLASNETHTNWLRDKVRNLLPLEGSRVAAVLGLTYKPGTNTLRRSASVELCRWLCEDGITVRAHDPAVRALPDELIGAVELCPSARDALTGADVAIIATTWPEYRELRAEDLLTWMRSPRVVDQSWFLGDTLASAPGIRYFAPGRAAER